MHSQPCSCPRHPTPLPSPSPSSPGTYTLSDPPPILYTATQLSQALLFSFADAAVTDSQVKLVKYIVRSVAGFTYGNYQRTHLIYRDPFQYKLKRVKGDLLALASHCGLGLRDEDWGDAKVGLQEIYRRVVQEIAWDLLKTLHEREAIVQHLRDTLEAAEVYLEWVDQKKLIITMEKFAKKYPKTKKFKHEADPAMIRKACTQSWCGEGWV
ncbi:hypothetical protein CTheo_9000 [Ceratobasidium theobromae]|uniref:Uncharacterized protein n=1 Tax=Ceratobasidium theobromae TaxID=1582974 RepID=A0A5N5Q7Z5_9AGAM|nr:hypothetical protein CTheo_9000 [Ceratobasidium theobromae]